MRFATNLFADRGAYTTGEARIVSRASAETALGEISRWAEYSVTPLHRLRGLAESVGVSTVLYKDESERFGIGSFKALGGAYAAMLELRSYNGEKTATLCCATDGNHGQSVALAAKKHGCSCVVFMHEHALPEKVAAIQALGAKVVRVQGTYDDSVKIAARTAAAEHWLLIPDTNEDPHDQTVLHVMQGYGVMVLEIIQQLEKEELPTHVFIQSGVGALAAGVTGVLSDIYAEHRPTTIVVEPEAAACLLESNLRLGPSRVGGNLRTEMAMLATGAASAAAWPILERRVDAFLAIEDAAAISARRQLTNPDNGDDPLDVSVSGAAGVAGLLEVAQHPKLSRSLGLTRSAQVLVIGTESGSNIATSAQVLSR